MEASKRASGRAPGRLWRLPGGAWGRRARPGGPRHHFSRFFLNFREILGPSWEVKSEPKSIKIDEKLICFSEGFPRGFLIDLGSMLGRFWEHFWCPSWNTSKPQKSLKTFGFSKLSGVRGFQKQVENLCFSDIALEIVFGRLWGSVLRPTMGPKTGPRQDKIGAKSDQKNGVKNKWKQIMREMRAWGGPS